MFELDDSLDETGSLLTERSESNEELQQWDEDWILSEELSLPSISPPSSSDLSLTPEGVLEKYWGYSAFRPLQKEIVLSALEGRDTLGLLPTGGGKSITFQVPGLMLPGLTLVVTPLISLMKDQVDHLRSKNIRAAAIYSGMSYQHIRSTLDNCIYGQYKFLYISPERLSSEDFRRDLPRLDISLLVVDECHCICQWGYDFRPSYLNILDIRQLLPQVPLLALTATATPAVEAEIMHSLGFREGAQVFRKSFHRPNLAYVVRRCEDKIQMLKHILSSLEGTSIIYLRNRDRCRQLSDALAQAGFTSTYYHAGLTHAERELRQKRWKSGEIRIMVATNAFGMGIDKPDVRLVIHLSMPSSLEEYFQEAGRAGRDGLLAYAVCLVDKPDARLLRQRMADAFPSKDYVRKVYDQVCNYLGIGEGEGYQHSYDIDLRRLCINHKLHPIHTRSAVDILQVAKVWTYKEDETRSRLQILYTKDALYEAHVGHDIFLRALLRRYTGLFTDYVFVSEHDIALDTGYTNQEVYGTLVMLSQRGILHYIPHKNIPRLIFHVRREDSRLINIPPSAYEERMERMQERIQACIDYIEGDKECRSRTLLRYFGEEATLSCGECDVCKRRVQEELNYHIVLDVLSVLERLISQHKEKGDQTPLTLSELCQSLPYTKERISQALVYIVGEREDLSLVGNLIYLRDENPLHF